jgi:ABC-2 type transport system permease protein
MWKDLKTQFNVIKALTIHNLQGQMSGYKYGFAWVILEPLVFIAGFRIVDYRTVPLAILFMVLIGCLFAAMGTSIGSVLENIQGFQLVMNLLVMPIFFLSGALYPLSNLPSALGFITKIDPLAYGVDGLRTTLIGVSHFGLLADFSVLIGVAVAFLLLGSHLFSKIEV